MIRRLLRQPPTFYLTALVILLSWVWSIRVVLTFGSALFRNDSWHIVQSVVLNGDHLSNFFTQHGPHHFGLAGVLHSILFGLGLENAVAHGVVEMTIWACSGMLATAIIVQWRGKWRYADAFVPLLFFLPGVWLNATSDPYIHSFTVFFTLLFIYFSTGYMKPVKLVLMLISVFAAAFTFNAVLVALAVAVYYTIHWLRTHWYTSGIVAAWSFLMLILVFLLTPFAGVEETSPIEWDALGSLKYLFVLIASFSFEIPYPFVEYVSVPVALFVLYILIHPWIRPRKKNRHEYGLWLLMTVLFLYWILNAVTRGDSPIGNAFATRYQPMISLLLFGLYWSALVQRRAPKKMYVIVILIAAWSFYGSYRVFKHRTPLYVDRMNVEWEHTQRGLKHQFEEPCYLHPHPERVEVDRSIEQLFP